MPLPEHGMNRDELFEEVLSASPPTQVGSRPHVQPHLPDGSPRCG